MYLRVTTTTQEFDLAEFPGATHVEELDHAGVANVYRPCHEFAWERDGEWWVSFDGGDSKIESPEWDEWGLVAELPQTCVHVSQGVIQ